MNIDISVYCDVYRSVGDEVCRRADCRVNSDVEGEVGSGYGEWFELEIEYQAGSRDDISFNKGVKRVKGWLCVGVGISLGWCVCVGVVQTGKLALMLELEMVNN